MLDKVCIWHEGFFPIRGSNEEESPAEDEGAIDWFNIDDLIALSFVYFKMNEAEFLEYTPFEFNRLLEIKQNERTNDWKLDMERMRLQTWHLVNIHSKDDIKDYSKYMPFEWDITTEKQDESIKEPTEEEWDHYDSIGTTGQRKKE